MTTGGREEYPGFCSNLTIFAYLFCARRRQATFPFSCLHHSPSPQNLHFPSLIFCSYFKTVKRCMQYSLFIYLQHHIIQFSLYYCQVVAYRRVNTNEHFKRSALKVVAVAAERCFLTRGSKFSALTRSLLVFRKTGR